MAIFVDKSKSEYPQATEHYVTVYGTGDVKTAITDLRDIGRVVARILADTRTLNQYVFIWAEEVTISEAIALAEKALGKKLEQPHVGADDLEQRLREADDLTSLAYEYMRSLWVRGDNTIANAKRPEYGGALDARKLYPDIKLRTLEQVVQECADGLGKRKE